MHRFHILRQVFEPVFHFLWLARRLNSSLTEASGLDLKSGKSVKNERVFAAIAGESRGSAIARRGHELSAWSVEGRLVGHSKV